jgi:hypothetical protein
MIMRRGESWHCTNRSCNSEILVQAESQSDGQNPRCSCGAVMKKKYRSPVFRYLDFLRIEEPALAEHPAHPVPED